MILSCEDTSEEGNDRVICYMGAYVVSGGAGDAYSRRGVSLGSFIDYI